MNYHISGNSKVGIPEKIIEIQDLKFEDNSTVFCANFISAFVVPKQNKNVKYIGFILPEEYIQNGYFTKKNKRYANRYYSNKFLEEKIIKEIKESENLYIIFTEETLGPLFSDLSLYIKALNKYSNGNYNKLNNCNLVENTTFDKKYSINRYLVCKIK